MSPILRILENEVQIVALLFMAAVYFLRLIWLFRFRPTRVRTRAEGSAGAGAAYSLLAVARPQAMESTRRQPFFYVQFVFFHLGVAAGIATTFIIPYSPSLFDSAFVVLVFQMIMALGLGAGLLRLVRRVFNFRLRRVSAPDDYVSLVLLIFFFGLGIVAAASVRSETEWPLVPFFLLTAFFLIYVPFSKIGHYLYYPFSRLFLGKTLGHRDVFPPRISLPEIRMNSERRRSGEAP
jgi:hypothetical protein